MQRLVLPLLRALVLCFVLLCVGLIGWSGFTPKQSAVYAEEDEPAALGSISGVVRNTVGEPLSGMTITLYQPYPLSNDWFPIAQMTTDAQGRYRFAALGAGIYRIGAVDPNLDYSKTFYASASNLWQGDDLVVNGVPRTNVDLTLAVGGTITGLVQATNGITLGTTAVHLYQKVIPTDFVDGQTSPWLQVAVRTLNAAHTDFQFEGLNADAYRVCATSAGGGRECYNDVYDFANAQSLTITEGALISNIVISLGDGADLGEIRGRVTSPADEPLANISVYALPRNDPSAYPPATITPQPTQPPSEEGLSQGIVASQPQVTPTPTALNLIYQAYTHTDVDGSYTLKNLYAGDYQLFFYDASGHHHYTYYDNVTERGDAAAITIAPKTVVMDVNTQLGLGAQITGTIKLLGEPAPLSTVALYRQEDERWATVATTTSDPWSGAYMISGLPAGDYRLQAITPIGFSPYTIRYLYAFYGSEQGGAANIIRLETGTHQSNIDIDFDHAPRFNGAISGLVTVNGLPRAGVIVSLYNNPFFCCNPIAFGRPSTYVTTDQEGRYRIDGLSDNSYYVRYEDPSGLGASIFYPNSAIPEDEFRVKTTDAEATTNIDVALPAAGVIQGQVQRRSGELPPALAVVAVLARPDNVTFLYRETALESDGSYRFQGLYPGAYHICTGIKTIYSSSYSSLECYGNFDLNQQLTSGQPITVTAGQTVNGIDLLWGPDYKQYLPVVAR